MCKHPTHDKFPRKNHVLVCEEHNQSNENKQLLVEYKSKCILKYLDLPDFSKEIKLSFHISNSIHNSNKINQPIYSADTTAALQYNIFYNTGCRDMVSRYSAIKRLGKRTKQEYKGPVQLRGVREVKTESKFCIYKIELPPCSVSDAVLSGVCLEKITESFPIYQLQGKVLEYIFPSFKKSGGNRNDLPRISVSVGGNINFMIRIKYLRHHPKLIYQLPSGFSIYESMFKNTDGTRAVIGGPHEVFRKIEEQFKSNISNTFNSK